MRIKGTERNLTLYLTRLRNQTLRALDAIEPNYIRRFFTTLAEQGLKQEHLRVVLLDTKNHVTNVQAVYVGSLNTTLVRVSEVFREAIRLHAAAVIVVHNHPSGDPTPSPEDVHVTRQIVEAGKLLDIDVLDHLVIGQNRWVSLKERGLGF